MKPTEKKGNVMNKTTETKTTFADILRKYESATRNRRAETETEFALALQTLATACVYSVLKKLANVGGTVTETSKATSDTTKTIRELRRTLTADINALNRLQYATENATEYRHNADGERERVITDRPLYDASKKLASETL
jgi:hypothetical protein